ncbi:MAG: cyclic nucleotide-binding domain-containing protein [Pirellulales bacterium]|nr:cyclic nucleotide-binding domain-containing protein [Pirellulales bacterium]HCK40946.1 hypothetical protein [Planctomycetaceae bacterium]
MSLESLAHLKIFQGMSDQQRDQVLALAQPIRVNAGEQLITQGKMLRNLWFILSGRCQVTRRTESGRQLNLAELGPHVQFGEMSFFQAAPHSADVIAITDMELLRIAREDYDALAAAGNPVAFKLALNALEQLANRLRRTDEWITDLVYKENHQPSPSEWTTFRELIFRGQ